MWTHCTIIKGTRDNPMHNYIITQTSCNIKVTWQYKEDQSAEDYTTERFKHTKANIANNPKIIAYKEFQTLMLWNECLSLPHAHYVISNMYDVLIAMCVVSTYHLSELFKQDYYPERQKIVRSFCESFYASRTTTKITHDIEKYAQA